jgi:protein gp37
MSTDTAIAWTDHTFNPWWGCTKVSAGCDNCYAEAFARRTGHDVWGAGAAHRFFGDNHWKDPFRWKDGRVFCGSMCDVFEPGTDLDEQRARLWSVIEMTPHLTWQLLTKRPERILSAIPTDWVVGGLPANVWVGTTVETQTMANLRIPRLLKVPARVRFLSCEPLLEPVELLRWLGYQEGQPATFYYRGIDWVIAGGESGPRRRLWRDSWGYALRDQCAATGVPFFFKQVGALRPGLPGPDDLMVREFPS